MSLENMALFVEDGIPKADESGSASTAAPWKILLVDDEQGVHDVTLMALKRFRFQDRSLQFLHALSAAEAFELLRQHSDVAVALIDVVMESDDAGLKLVERIRNELRNSSIRLILRTGQPGVAPEEEVVQNYDINDYKDKTELTKQKLSTTMFAALRSYRDIIALEQSRSGLEKVIESTATLYQIHDLNGFIGGLLSQVIGIAGICVEGKVLASGFLAGNVSTSPNAPVSILAGNGIYQDCVNQPLETALSEEIRQQVELALKVRDNQYFDDATVFYIENSSALNALIYLPGRISDDSNQRNLIELFCKNIGIAFENVGLNREIENTQQEIIYTLGSVAEFRSKETSEHVHRVALYVELLARLLGLPEAEVEMIKMASPLHDIGKMAIPDEILKKPGKLTEAEFEIMKSHTTRGYDMLCHSTRPLLQTAATIALTHQEKWDGSGYPAGLKHHEIPLYGRIVAIADVFDALGSARCYKKGWTLEKILEYFKQQSGQHFDPELVDLLLQNLDQFLQVREQGSLS